MQKGKLNTHRQAFIKYNMDIDKKFKHVTNDHTLTRWIDYLAKVVLLKMEQKYCDHVQDFIQSTQTKY